METVFNQARQTFTAQAATGGFLFTRCRECDRWMWPPVGPCPGCNQETLEWVEVAGTGTIGARCEVHRGMDPPFAAETPYVAMNDMRAYDFRRSDPRFDGRGITVAVLEFGTLDFMHPSLQKAKSLDGSTIQKLRGDAELSALLPAAIESIPQVEEILAKKAENRPVTPEEYTMLGQFVDRVERRTIQMKEDATRAVEERTASALSEVPTAAFGMPLEDIGLKEHVFNILVEAGIDNVGALMMSMKMDANKVLGLPGIGPKAITNIEERLAAIQFPEPTPAEPAEEPVAEPVAQAEAQPQPEAPVAVAEPVTVTETPADEKQAPVKKEPKGKIVEEQEDDEHKDGVSLDELFSMKPEIFQTAAGEEEDSADKKKGKKGKKKSVELEFDEERGEVVGRKKHKRGDEDLSEDW